MLIHAGAFCDPYIVYITLNAIVHSVLRAARTPYTSCSHLGVQRGVSRGMTICVDLLSIGYET